MIAQSGIPPEVDEMKTFSITPFIMYGIGAIGFIFLLISLIRGNGKTEIAELESNMKTIGEDFDNAHVKKEAALKMLKTANDDLGKYKRLSEDFKNALTKVNALHKSAVQQYNSSVESHIETKKQFQNAMIFLKASALRLEKWEDLKLDALNEVEKLHEKFTMNNTLREHELMKIEGGELEKSEFMKIKRRVKELELKSWSARDAGETLIQYYELQYTWNTKS